MNDSPLPPAERMKGYLQKIATGPRMSKDLTEAEAEDGLRLVLEGRVSPIRSALFLVAARMKLETIEENRGFWRALDRTTRRKRISRECLLQVAEAFDGFERVPGLSFYAIPLIAHMGLSAYGHSALPLPPKHGITFEDLLQNHYRSGRGTPLALRARLIEEFGFGYLGTEQSHPLLESLRPLREEIVKRPMLATLEKMLQPLTAARNLLATSYFHPGYEVSMLEVARLSVFDRVLIGNGMEGGTLYGVHKPARLFIKKEDGGQEERSFDLKTLYPPRPAQEVSQAYAELKTVASSRDMVARLGESGLKGEPGPAAALIACQVSVWLWLLARAADPATAYEQARGLLSGGRVYEALMRYLEACRS